MLESLSNSAVTIEVAAGTYDEDDLIDFTNNDTINIIGAGLARLLSTISLGPDIAIGLGIVSIRVSPLKMVPTEVTMVAESKTTAC